MVDATNKRPICSLQATTWRASWEKRLVPSRCWSESSPGNLSSGWAWKKSACEVSKRANDIHLQSSAGSEDLHTPSQLRPPRKASLTA